MGDFFTVASLVFVGGWGIRLATPFLLAGLGEAIGQRSGVLNLGVDDSTDSLSRAPVGAKRARAGLRTPDKEQGRLARDTHTHCFNANS